MKFNRIILAIILLIIASSLFASGEENNLGIQGDNVKTFTFDPTSQFLYRIGFSQTEEYPAVSYDEIDLNTTIDEKGNIIGKNVVYVFWMIAGSKEGGHLSITSSDMQKDGDSSKVIHMNLDFSDSENILEHGIGNYKGISPVTITTDAFDATKLDNLGSYSGTITLTYEGK